MKELMKNWMTDDETRQAFTRRELVVYGVIAPLVLVAVMCLAGWMETVL